MSTTLEESRRSGWLMSDSRKPLPADAEKAGVPAPSSIEDRLCRRTTLTKVMFFEPFIAGLDLLLVVMPPKLSNDSAGSVK